MTRKAVMADVPDIHRLVTHYAERNRMLFRSHADLYEHLRDFFVCLEPVEGTNCAVGCAALELVWHDLAEIKSLAVDKRWLGKGVGTHLVKAATQEALQLGLKRLFALTYEQAFFESLGFRAVAKETLPHKVWTDCLRCTHQENCDEIAMVLELKATEAKGVVK